MLTSDEEEKPPHELEEALAHVVTLEKLHLSNALSQMRELKSQAIKLRAHKLYAGKEVEALSSGRTDDLDGNDLITERDELQTAALNHTLIRDMLQNAVFNVQMQDAVRTGLIEIDLDEPPEHFPERGVLLSKSSCNMDKCKSFVGVIREKEELDKEILQLQLKYRRMLKTIAAKWSAKESKDQLKEVKNPTPEFLWLQKKISDRERKLEFLSVMIQGLISTSGVTWAMQPFYVQALLLTEFKHYDRAKQMEIIQRLKTLREAKSKMMEKEAQFKRGLSSLRSTIPSTASSQ